MTEQFAQHGIDARFFSAFEIHGPVENVPGYDAQARRRRYGFQLTKGEVGCYLSHRAVWHQLVESGDDAWCVMEDDLMLVDGFKKTTAELYETRAHWDVVRLMGIIKRPQTEYAVLGSGVKVMWMDRQPVGSQCYVLTRDAAIRLLDYTDKILHALDIAIDRHWEHGLRLFITSPEFVSHAAIASTIGPRDASKTLAIRMKEKLYRRLDKFSAALYNARNRPTKPTHLSSNF
jgi:glycosyl transferase family 25